MSDRPQNDPLPDNLVELTDAQRDEEKEKLNILRPHLQDGVAQVEVARASNVPLHTIQRWVSIATLYRDVPGGRGALTDGAL